MNPLTRIERAIEEAIEGLFRKGREATHPVEIGRFLVREMEDEKRISVSRTYVPNHYRVKLHERDVEHIAPLARTLTRELADHVISRARRQGYSFVGRVKVEFVPDEGARPGDIRVEASFIEGEEPPSDTAWRPGNDTGRARSAGFTGAGREPADETCAEGADEGDTLDRTRMSGEEPGRSRLSGGPWLVLPGEGNSERVCALEGERVVIGRAASCDIVVCDPGVSRRHAEITRNGGRFCITDLQSTNGTFVNGRRVSRQLLADGDLISLGRVRGRFKEV
ncbi:MAG: DUF3662 and FHA domain-containing protein [Bacillota bacterium]